MMMMTLRGFGATFPVACSIKFTADTAITQAIAQGVNESDPSRCADAWDALEHLAQQVNVACLLYTHGRSNE